MFLQQMEAMKHTWGDSSCSLMCSFCLECYKDGFGLVAQRKINFALYLSYLIIPVCPKANSRRQENEAQAMKVEMQYFKHWL